MPSFKIYDDFYDEHPEGFQIVPPTPEIFNKFVRQFPQLFIVKRSEMSFKAAHHIISVLPEGFWSKECKIANELVEVFIKPSNIFSTNLRFSIDFCLVFVILLYSIFAAGRSNPCLLLIRINSFRNALEHVI